MFSLCLRCKTKTNKIFGGCYKKNFVDLQNFQNPNFVRGKFWKIRSSIKLSLGYVRSQTKFGPDRFSRFDVYWIQTNKHPDKQRISTDWID